MRRRCSATVAALSADGVVGDDTAAADGDVDGVEAIWTICGKVVGSRMMNPFVNRLWVAKKICWGVDDGSWCDGRGNAGNFGANVGSCVAGVLFNFARGGVGTACCCCCFWTITTGAVGIIGSTVGVAGVVAVGDGATIAGALASKYFRPILYLTLRNRFSVGCNSACWTIDGEIVVALLLSTIWPTVPSELAWQMTLTRFVTAVVVAEEEEEEAVELQLLLSSSDRLKWKWSYSGGGVGKLCWSRAYKRFRGGKSDSSSESDGFGVISPLGNDAASNPTELNWRFSESAWN